MKRRDYYNSICIVCSKEFHVKPSSLKRKWGKCCSKKCRDENQKNGKFLNCFYCGKEIYRTPSDLRRESKTKTYFCSKSCQCVWKNKRRKKKTKLLNNLLSWRPWCSSSTRTCGVLGEGAEPSGLPNNNNNNSNRNIISFLKLKKKRSNFEPIKRPSKKILYYFYWKKNYSQSEITQVFNVTHTSVKRWLNYYKISIKPRALSCGRNPKSIKNLELGKTKKALRKSAESRTIYSKYKLIKGIRRFVKEEGRIPTKNEFSKNPLYPNHATLRDYFGTWNNAIKAAGYEPHKRWFILKNSKTLQAKDGHLCNSFSEIIIDNWFYKNNIHHEREYPYPEKRYRCDFVINDIFIEFFGLAYAPLFKNNYNLIMENKRRLCRKYKIPLIELYERDLSNLDEILGQKLENIKRSRSLVLSSLLSKVQFKFF